MTRHVGPLRQVPRQVGIVAAWYSAALAATLALWTPLLRPVPFALFYLAVAAAANHAGFWPGLTVAALAAATAGAWVPGDAEGVAQVALFVSVSAVIARSCRGRERSEAALGDQREQYRVTLASIGDAVVAADARSRVAFLNPEAERLTGWQAGPAVGRPLAEVVRLVREGDAAIAPDKWDRGRPDAARTPPGTWLLTKGGGRVPVEDSAAPIRSASGEVIGSVIVFRDVAERRRGDDRRARQADRLRLLSESTGRLLASDRPEAMLPGLFEGVLGHLGLDAYFHYAVADGGNFLRLESCLGIPGPAAAAFGRVEFGQAVCGAVAATRQAVVVDELRDSDEPAFGPLKALGFRAFACIPLLAGDHLLGTLAFALRGRDRFDDGEMQVLRAVCHHAALAMDRARMLAEAEERADRLAEGESLLRMAVELAELGTWVYEPSSGAFSCSDRCRAVFGLAEGAVGYEEFVARIHPGDRDRVLAANAVAMQPGGAGEYNLEHRAVRPDGSVRWVAAMGRGLLAPSPAVPVPARLIGTVLDITERVRVERERGRLADRLAEQGRQAAILEERRRISCEIHDTLAQGFTGIVVLLEAAEQASGRSPEAVLGRISQARDLARASLADARKSVRALRPIALEGGDLAGALRRLADRVPGGSGLRAEFTLDGDPVPLADAFEDNLLRIAQEAITNALKHAGAEVVRVGLDFGPGYARLRVQDDGIGFAAAEGERQGFGLLGMRERAERIGAGLEIYGRPGVGTAVTVTVPLDRGGARDGSRRDDLRSDRG